ncbi:Pr6Pr family membrane protein [Jatrophihabitans sp. DSM 45814]
MSRSGRNAASIWHLLTGLVIITGLIWQLVLVLQNVNVLADAAGNPPSSATRVIRFFSYFTVESNILVAITALTLARRPDRDGKVWRVLRLCALFGIIVTGIVYSTLLRGVVDLHGAAAVTNALLHYAAPLMAAIGWLLFGPRPRIDENTLVLSLIWPALYVIYTFIHGAISKWYPYPFIDVNVHGYVTVIRNGIALNVLLIGIGALLMWLDHRLPRVNSGSKSTSDQLTADHPTGDTTAENQPAETGSRP